MSLIENKAEISYAGLLEKAQQFTGSALRKARSRAFRDFLKSVDDDYARLRIAEVDLMRTAEAVALVQAGWRPEVVAKMALRAIYRDKNFQDNDKSSAPLPKDLRSMQFLLDEWKGGKNVVADMVHLAAIEEQILKIAAKEVQSANISLEDVGLRGQEMDQVDSIVSWYVTGRLSSIQSPSEVTEYPRTVTVRRWREDLHWDVETSKGSKVLTENLSGFRSKFFRECSLHVQERSNLYVCPGWHNRRENSKTTLVDLHKAFIKIKSAVAWIWELACTTPQNSRWETLRSDMIAKARVNGPSVPSSADKMREWLDLEWIDEITQSGEYSGCETDIYVLKYLECHNFRGAAEHDEREALVGKLVASRLQGTKLAMKQRHSVTAYSDVTLVSTDRQSGLIMPDEHGCILMRPGEDAQTLEHIVKPGDVLELYHFARFAVTGQIGLHALMKRCEGRMEVAEQYFQSDVLKMAAKGVPSLEKLTEDYGGLRPYAHREFVCCMARVGVEIQALTSKCWHGVQLGYENGYKVTTSYNGPKPWRLTSDKVVMAEGIVNRGPFVNGRNTSYNVITDRNHVNHIQTNPDKTKVRKKRGSASTLAGSMAGRMPRDLLSNRDGVPVNKA